MIGGDETRVSLEEGASQDLAYRFSTKSDASDVSPSISRYSSRGESDIEKYCSANSAMGAPSLGSSISTFHECIDSELGSMKNFGPGKVSGLEDLCLDGRDVKSHLDYRLLSLDRFDCLGHHKTDGIVDLQSAASIGSFDNDDSGAFMLPMLEGRSKISRVEDLNTDLEEFVYRTDGNENVVPWVEHGNTETSQNSTQIASNEIVIDGQIVESGLLDRESDFNFLSGSGFEEKTPEKIFSEQVKGCFNEASFTPISQHDENEAGTDDELSSIYEHSEGEDSIYNNDVVDELKYNLCSKDKIQYGLDLVAVNGNPLTMNSSIAFGSEDWDDFELQTRDGSLTSTILNHFKEPKQVNLETEMTLEKSSNVILGGPVKRDAIDTHRATNQAPHNDELGRYFKSCRMNEFSDSTISEHGNIENKPRITDQFGGAHNYTEYLEICDVSNTFEAMQDPLQQKEPDNINMEIIGIHKSKLDILTVESQTELEDSHKFADFFEDLQTALPKIQEPDSIPFYDEVVDDMEEILFEVNNSPGANIRSQSHVFSPLRDGGSSASTSSKDDTSMQYKSHRIDGIELVGAKQKKGDVSLGERLVGVKEYTVYIIRVFSGNDEWVVEHRYRDFVTLYYRLKSFYVDQGWILPSPWSSVELESKKIFGSSSPNVVAQRSILIQDCLHSILHSRASSSLPSAFILFLSPKEDMPGSSPTSNLTTSFTLFNNVPDSEAVSPYGNMISFIVEIQPHRSIRQLLEAQHYTCAGCHINFDGGNMRLFEFVQTFGRGKPRVCDYTGQLYCSTCHRNDTAVIPARVLHHWDFTHCPVSQLAMSYLDSIHDQPMLCVSAVNPLLFSKVPSLRHIMSVRRKVAAMLPIVRCPFRRSINKGFGSRRYLLEDNDFFALRDLVDLSKGPFAALPVMIENISTKILQHITEHCLICCDVGVPCGARQACDDPSSLIFSFQGDEVEKCRSCDLVFHKPCFKTLNNCVCGAILNPNNAILAQSSEFYPTNQTRNLKSAAGFLSGLFSRAKGNECRERKEDNVILMSHLPTDSL